MKDVRQTAHDLKDPLILLVGDLESRRNAKNLPDLEGMVFSDVRDLKTSLSEHEPDIVLSLLIDGDFDAFLVAQTLQTVCFKGIYRIMCDHVISHTAILAELNHVAPDLDIDFLLLDVKSNNI